MSFRWVTGWHRPPPAPSSRRASSKSCAWCCPPARACASTRPPVRSPCNAWKARWNLKAGDTTHLLRADDLVHLQPRALHALTAGKTPRCWSPSAWRRAELRGGRAPHSQGPAHRGPAADLSYTPPGSGLFLHRCSRERWIVDSQPCGGTDHICHGFFAQLQKDSGMNIRRSASPRLRATLPWWMRPTPPMPRSVPA